MAKNHEGPPPPHPLIQEYLSEKERQNAEVDALTGSINAVQANWRPRQGVWSLLENLEHLTLTNRVYVDAMEEVICRGRAMGTTGEGPYRHGWIGTRFVRSMEPPPKLRTKTLKAINPSTGPDPEPMSRAKVVGDFFDAQAGLGAALERASGLDLGRVRFRSPLFWLLKLSLGQGFEMLLAHNRRHLWQIQRVVEHPDFP